MSLLIQPRSESPRLWEGLARRVRAFFASPKATRGQQGKGVGILPISVAPQDTETGETLALIAAYEANKHKFAPILAAYGEDEPDYSDSIQWHNPNYKPSNPAI